MTMPIDAVPAVTSPLSFGQRWGPQIVMQIARSNCFWAGC